MEETKVLPTEELNSVKVEDLDVESNMPVEVNNGGSNVKKGLIGFGVAVIVLTAVYFGFKKLKKAKAEREATVEVVDEEENNQQPQA